MGVRHRSAHADRWRGNGIGRRRATANEQPIDEAWKRLGHNGPLRVSYPWQYRDRVDGYFRAKWTKLHSANACHVLRCYTVRLRVCKVRDWPVLLPTRSKGLPRHELLSGPRRALGCLPG